MEDNSNGHGAAGRNSKSAFCGKTARSSELLGTTSRALRARHERDQRAAEDRSSGADD